jgi:hypothetical protein
MNEEGMILVVTVIDMSYVTGELELEFDPSK